MDSSAPNGHPSFATRKRRRPLGELFVERGLITREQLAFALEEQSRTGSRLGEILIEHGYLTRLDLAGALAAHWEPQGAEDLWGDAPVNGGPPNGAHANGASPAGEQPTTASAEPRLEAAKREHPQDEPARPRVGLLRRARTQELDDLSHRVDALVEVMDGVGALERAVARLDGEFGQMKTVRMNDALATGARLAGVEAGVLGLADLEERLTASLRQSLEDAGTESAARVAELDARLDALAAQPVGDDARERLDQIAVRIDRVASDGLDRSAALAEDVASRLADLAARLDDLAGRDGESAGSLARFEADVERRLADADRVHQGELASLGARVDELFGLRRRDAQALEDRVHRLEAALADGDVAELSARVDDVEARAAAAEEIAEEWGRATERAVRDGLAALGKRLVGPEARYRKPGKGMRRSLERLGAAISEADEQAEGATAGHLAFAPTVDGYRLVELPGDPPSVGSTVELESASDRLVVTRHGCSPIPFDERVCVYLDRA